MSGGKFGNEKFENKMDHCSKGTDAAPDKIYFEREQNMARHSDRKITLTIRLDGHGINEVACYDIDAYELHEALESIKVSDNIFGMIFDGQTATQQNDIMRKRDCLWQRIQGPMQKFFFDKIFSRNDTINGYKEGE
jgi:hypothetical protein